MRQSILNLKLIGLIALLMVMFSCGEKNHSKETCLKYSTSFIENESQRLINKINHYTNINPSDIKGINISVMINFIN
jgi:hypothetical protein